MCKFFSKEAKSNSWCLGQEFVLLALGPRHLDNEAGDWSEV